MSGRGSMKPTDIGLRALLDLYDQLQIDEDWTEWWNRGFTWWPYQARQMVAASEPSVIDGATISRIHVKVPVSVGVSPSEQLLELISGLNAFAPGYAVIHDPRDQTLSYVSAASVHEGNYPYSRKLIATSAALQVAIASASELHDLAALYGGAADAEPHHANGNRQVRDDMVNVLDVYRASGQSPALDRSHFSRFRSAAAREIGLQVENDATEAWASFPGIFGPLPWSVTSTAHPSLGYGLLSLLRVSDDIGARAFGAANRLNSSDAYDLHSAEKRHHFFGAWTVRDGQLYFASFVPQLLYEANVAENGPMTMLNLAIEAAVRAQWTMSRLAEGFERAR